MATRFDIYFQVISALEQADTGRFVSWGTPSTIGVRGFQFLINVWLKCFLTPRGSDATDLDYGTDFTKLVGTTLPLTDAQDVALLAISQCNEIIIGFQRNESTLTATELLASAQLTNFVEDAANGRADVYIEIKNRANERLNIRVPVSAGE